jgi:hypothetical protein
MAPFPAPASRVDRNTCVIFYDNFCFRCSQPSKILKHYDGKTKTIKDILSIDHTVIQKKKYEYRDYRK